MKEKIKAIVIDEFSKLINIIEADFSANYAKKVNNFLLSQMDERITANMVFVSSFESKSGFAIETCAKRIARLRFGNNNVPTIVNPRNITIPPNVNASSISGQIVITDVDTTNGDLRGEIAAFRANNEAQGKGKSRIESRVTMPNIKSTLLPLSNKYKSNTIQTKPVDLAFFDGEMWNIMELKAGGDLDSSNAPANVEKLLTIYVDMGIENCNVYFSTLYNKDGEGNTWKGAVKKHLHYPSMFLIGKDFWNKILPNGITYEEFTQIYQKALEEINLNKRINNMISDCIGE
ncbi:TdeIII family type II restriction endonuclease [Clostridium sp. ASF356]|nr:TdeIII family type II restriction endonuclease [Clostridium sp. MD294]